MQAAGLAGREGAEAEREIGVESARIGRSMWRRQRRRKGKGASPELRPAARVAVGIGWRSMAAVPGFWPVPSVNVILLPGVRDIKGSASKKKKKEMAWNLELGQ